MEIDFSILDSMGPAAGSSKPAEAAREDAAPAEFKRQTEKATQKRNYALEVYKVYQERTKATEGLQNRIMKGLNTGEPIEDLFLLAIEALGLATDNTVMIDQARKILESRKSQ